MPYRVSSESFPLDLPKSCTKRHQTVSKFKWQQTRIRSGVSGLCWFEMATFLIYNLVALFSWLFSKQMGHLAGLFSKRGTSQPWQQLALLVAYWIKEGLSASDSAIQKEAQSSASNPFSYIIQVFIAGEAQCAGFTSHVIIQKTFKGSKCLRQSKSPRATSSALLKTFLFSAKNSALEGYYGSSM